jgi:hypothetical protein
MDAGQIDTAVAARAPLEMRYVPRRATGVPPGRRAGGAATTGAGGTVILVAAITEGIGSAEFQRLLAETQRRRISRPGWRVASSASGGRGAATTCVPCAPSLEELMRVRSQECK